MGIYRDESVLFTTTEVGSVDLTQEIPCLAGLHKDAT